MKKIITTTFAFLSLSCIANEAQDFNKNQSEAYVDIKVQVPSLCTISSGAINTINMGNFVKEEIVKNFTYSLACNQGTNVKFSIGLGSNPHSTPEKRRLPLNAQTGDVTNYLTYYIKNIDTEEIVATDEYALNRFLTSTSSTYRSLRLAFVMPVEQPNIIVGSYSDRLDVEIEYF